MRCRLTAVGTMEFRSSLAVLDGRMLDREQDSGLAAANLVVWKPGQLATPASNIKVLLLPALHQFVVVDRDRLFLLVLYL
ncbi:hypothetical protein ABID21_003004 [Pseudorhizobium tarimense]|uniref:Uncharacterized protein n=1 Tax=Pseudorhizobium tarimense TaxID=1079109 RepID=A0ABV2H9K3_9HYPH